MLNIRRNKNNRKFKRVDLEIEVKYQPIKYQNWYTTVTRNIGTDGVCLFSLEYLGIGSKVNIMLSFTKSRIHFTVIGLVLWSDFQVDRSLYESGIKFGKINNKEKELIANYIDSFILFKKIISLP